jgi:hypothetical protein
VTVGWCDAGGPDASECGNNEGSGPFFVCEVRFGYGVFGGRDALPGGHQAISSRLILHCRLSKAGGNLTVTNVTARSKATLYPYKCNRTFWRHSNLKLGSKWVVGSAGMWYAIMHNGGNSINSVSKLIAGRLCWLFSDYSVLAGKSILPCAEHARQGLCVICAAEAAGGR